MFEGMTLRKTLLLGLLFLSAGMIWYLTGDHRAHLAHASHMTDGSIHMLGMANSPLMFLPIAITGFLVMLMPCMVQMVMVLIPVIAGTTLKTLAEQEQVQDRAQISFRLTRFIIGFALIYMAVGLLLGISTKLANWDGLLDFLRLTGGVIILVVGAHLLGTVSFKYISRCAGPFHFLMGGTKGKIPTPFLMGISFGIYCIGCCGPYIYSVIVLAGSMESLWVNMMIMGTFMLMMSVPFLLAAVSLKLASRYLDRMAASFFSMARVSGALLVLFGSLILFETGSTYF